LRGRQTIHGLCLVMMLVFLMGCALPIFGQGGEEMQEASPDSVAEGENAGEAQQALSEEETQAEQSGGDVQQEHAEIVTGNAPEYSLLSQDDFVYLGAFRLPGEEERPLTFDYGGNAMTFNPSGNPGDGSGLPGSLFISGHDRLAYDELPDGGQIAEIGIPLPVISHNLEDLPYASLLQDFHNVAEGYFIGMDEIPRMGMLYLDAPATGARIHLAWSQHLQMEALATHAWFNPDLENPDLHGTWFIDDIHPYSLTSYMLEIPTEWAQACCGGQVIGTGRYRDGGQGGMGPSLISYLPWTDAAGSPAANGAHLPATTLLLYANAAETDNIEMSLNEYQHADEWEGAAWITKPSGASAVLFAGTKGTGSKYWYGFLNPEGTDLPCVDQSHVGEFPVCRLADGSLCPEEDMTECNNHTSQRGWWSTRFDAQFILYDPGDLLGVASGELESWEPQPYTVIDIDEQLFFGSAEWDIDWLGAGDQRRFRIGEVAYDRTNGYLYVLELYGDGVRPLVHVWQVQ